MDQEKERLALFAKEFYKSAPITVHQIGIGLGLSLFSTDSWKFHPMLFASPKWQLYRGISSFLLTGDNLGEALGSSIGLAFNSSLEHTLTTQRSPRSSARYAILDKIHNALSSLIKNPYLRAQVISGVVIISLEILFYKPKSSIVNPAWINAASEFLRNNVLSSADLTGALFLTPISLFRILDSSMKWIWTFMNSQREIKIGEYRLHPIWIPIISAFIFGKDGWSTSLKGFIASIIVAEVMNLRNHNGEPIVDSGLAEIYRTIYSSASRLYSFLC